MSQEIDESSIQENKKLEPDDPKVLHNLVYPI
jgi:hypothetical protein